MKKRTLALLLALVLCLSLFPMSASAAADPFKEKFFPGELEPFGKSYVDINNTVGNVEQSSWDTDADAYTPVPGMLNDMYTYFDTADDPVAEFGLYSEPYIYYQCDIALDDPNGWMMQPDWNWDNPNDFTYNGAYGDATTSESFGPDEKIYEHGLFDAYYEGTQQQLADAIVTGTDEYGDPVYQVDLNNHTLYFRFRWVVTYAYEDDSSNWHTIISPWSEVTSVGKNGTQKPLTEPTGFEAPVISDLVVVPPGEYESEAHIKYDVDFPDSLYNAYMWYNVNGNWADIGDIQGQINVDNKGWQDLYIGNGGWIYDGERSTTSTEALTKESHVQWRVRWSNDYFTSPWSNVLEVNAPNWEASDWAVPELEEADALGIIPDCLEGKDLTEDITRAEFAAVAVKAYEALTGVAAIPAVNNPFTDTNDVEVLKAYNTGITDGTSATKFSPNELLNREQAATMLTRVFKKVSLAGWTLATDSEFTLPYEKPALFADDKDISDWAKDSVYFMAANKIVEGIEGGKFAPKNVTDKQTATGYANATREQALLIAVRMVKNLGE